MNRTNHSSPFLLGYTIIADSRLLPRRLEPTYPPSCPNSKPGLFCSSQERACTLRQIGTTRNNDLTRLARWFPQHGIPQPCGFSRLAKWSTWPRMRIEDMVMQSEGEECRAAGWDGRKWPSVNHRFCLTRSRGEGARALRAWDLLLNPLSSPECS